MGHGRDIDANIRLPEFGFSAEELGDGPRGRLRKVALCVQRAIGSDIVPGDAITDAPEDDPVADLATFERDVRCQVDVAMGAVEGAGEFQQFIRNARGDAVLTVAEKAGGAGTCFETGRPERFVGAPPALRGAGQARIAAVDIGGIEPAVADSGEGVVWFEQAVVARWIAVVANRSGLVDFD